MLLNRASGEKVVSGVTTAAEALFWVTQDGGTDNGVVDFDATGTYSPSSPRRWTRAPR